MGGTAEVVVLSGNRVRAIRIGRCSGRAWHVYSSEREPHIRPRRSRNSQEQDQCQRHKLFLYLLALHLGGRSLSEPATALHRQADPLTSQPQGESELASYASISFSPSLTGRPVSRIGFFSLCGGISFVRDSQDPGNRLISNGVSSHGTPSLIL
jgi:hypothetical protein